MDLEILEEWDQYVVVKAVTLIELILLFFHSDGCKIRTFGDKLIVIAENSVYNIITSVRELNIQLNSLTLSNVHSTIFRNN